ncbi:MAG TPA: NAD-dependent DNA ligase LigA [Chitinophagaceae bacterium]
MYTDALTKKLTKSSSQLIAALPDIDKKDISLLREVLRFHEFRYYVQSDPLISDYEFDQLFKALEKIESENPSLITPGSPTQRIATSITREFATAQHLVPMLSLENSYNSEDLIDWDRKARDLTGLKTVEYCIEPKFDGASISVTYEDDMLVRAVTRGDGVTGEDVTVNVKQIYSIPLSAPFSDYGIQQIEIRGEVMMSKKNFKKYNDRLAEQNLPPLANPRNAASGTLRIKDPREAARRGLEAFLYHISYVHTNGKGTKKTSLLETHSGSLQLLWELGFRCPNEEKKVVKGIEGVIEYCTGFEKQRDDLPYEIDGMVIKVNNLELQDKMGMTTHHPRWAMAFKFKARQATSKLRAVEFQVGRTGSITPVAKIDPTPIGGVTVTSISLFNEEVIREKDLRIGDTVLAERAGDVIPYIVRSLPELRTGIEKEIKFPKECPACGHKLIKSEDEAAWRCVNISCKAQVLERLIHFTSKDAMDIRGLGAANIQKFFELGFLKDIPGIYRLPFDKIQELEGFGQKSMTNLQAAIEASKKQPLHRVIFALGIRYVGETMAKTLANSVHYLPDFKDYSVDDLQKLEDVGPKVAGSLYQFFHNDDNLKLLKELEQLGLTLTSQRSRKSATADNLGGQTFLFTGTLSKLKRSEAEAMVEQQGGTILTGVSSKLNYLVVGEDAGSKLEKAKKIPTIRIISEEEFLQLATP